MRNKIAKKKYNTWVLLFFIIAGALSVPSCEPDKKMAVETGDASNISTTTAEVSGTIIDIGEGATQHGHCYGTSSNPTTSGSKTTLGVAASGDFTSNLTGLQPETKYYVRAYTSLGSEAAYGSEITFTTASVVLPEITTTAITNITENSAISGGNITRDGGAEVTSRGVCWSTSNNPTTANSKTSDASGTGSFVSTLTGLIPGITYYVKAYAANSAGTAYGNELSFTTSVITPTLTTTTVTSITSTTAGSGGNISNNGGAPVTARGVCWNTSPYPTTANNVTLDGTGTGSFTSGLTSLTPETTYFIRAYATNSVGTAYGNELSFTTGVAIPNLSTTAITSITTSTASSGGQITSEGGASVTTRGICWSTSSNPTTTDSKTTDGTGSGVYSSILTGLQTCTQYYVRAYATNQYGTAYGDEKTFATKGLPTVTTASITGITNNLASSGGNVTNDCGSAVTVRGVCWSTSQNPAVTDSHTSDGSGTGSFISNITGLALGTTYYVRAYATNSVGTAYGNELNFIAAVVTPVLNTTAITSITSATASSGGTISDDGGAAVTARGVCWSNSANPTIANSKTSDGTGTGGFTSSLTGLTANTIYYLRAYATNTAGTAYGNELSFTTSYGIPVLSTTAITSISTTTASSGGNITNDGGSSITAHGVCWSTSSSPTTADSKTSDGSGAGVFSSSMTGLQTCTLYFVRAYATSQYGTAYGDEKTFTTKGLPAITTESVTGITNNSASSGGNVTNDCGWAVTARGVCWSTSQNPVVTGSHTSDGSGTGSFISNITGLALGTAYYVRAYATNILGTTYGNELSFTTSISIPTLTTTAVTSVTSATASSGGTITNDGGAAVTARGVCWNTSQNPTTANNKTDNGTGSGSFLSNITGLSPGTLYYVRAYATNSAGTAYGTERSFTTSVELPSLTTMDVTAITLTTAASGGNITSNGGAAVTSRGVCWNTSPYPTTANNKTDDGSGTGAYTSSITGLKPGTLYYLRAYATNSAGTGYGNEISFTTVTVVPTLTTTPISAIATTSSRSGGNITSDGGASITVRGVCWNTSASPTITNNKTEDGSGTSSFYSIISGLTGNTTYFLRAYATNSAGTGYGDEHSFTTTSSVADYDGNTYNTVQIGTQLWMQENLKATKYCNGELIGTTTPATLNISVDISPKYQWPYDGNESNVAIYGRLYTWYTVTDSRNVCPAGWHVPSDEEWTTLETFLITNGFNYDGTTTGNKIAKSLASTTLWDATANIGAIGNTDYSNKRNSTGFTAFPGGFRRYDGIFQDIGSSGHLWSATEGIAGYAWHRKMNNDGISTESYSANPRNGYSVRCLKD